VPLLRCASVNRTIPIAKASSRLDLRFVMGAFAAVAVAFFIADEVTERVMAQIDVTSDQIAFNSASSIEHLVALQRAVSQVKHLIRTELTDSGGGGRRAGVDEALARATKGANAYLALPTFPGEEEVYLDLSSSLTDFHGTLERSLAQVGDGALKPSQAELTRIDETASKVIAAAQYAIEFNARNGRELALQSKATRRSSSQTGYLLNAGCALFAGIAALIGWRQLRRYRTLVDEHAALQASRAEELESFAARAAHDILNPVSATQMALALAARRDIQDGRVRQLVEQALSNQKRVRNIIDGLLQFARSGARSTAGAVADVWTVVQDEAAGIRLIAEHAGIELRVGKLPRCHAACSEGVLASVVSNLVNNAIKYMGEREVRRITVRALQRGPFVHVEVEDSGPGIPSDAVGVIFRPFVRGPAYGKGGLGLGLATVKRLCEAHGGSVGVKSAVGLGSLFWFELPLAPATPATAA
jgi:signal transduction histidine kinase